LSNEGAALSNRLAGRVALISGGTLGIGRAIAEVFQREGACVFILGRDSVQGNATAAELTRQLPGLPVRYIPSDLRHSQQIQNALSCLSKFHSKVDILVNNAGIEMDKTIEKLTAEDWDS
jgi:NAD(P)-dependent dehydrogenase (short-subunit alcohol dehydrogenase family)